MREYGLREHEANHLHAADDGAKSIFSETDQLITAGMVAASYETAQFVN